MRRTIITLLGFLMLVSPVSIFAAGPPKANVVVSNFSEQDRAESTKMTGILYFDRVSGLSTEVAGLVNSVLVKAGDRVKKGAKLFTLNTDFTDKELALKKTEIAQIEILLEQARKNTNRIEELFKKKAVSEAEYDDLFFTLRSQQKNLESKKIDLQRIVLKKKKSVIRAPYHCLILAKNVDIGDWVNQGTVLCRTGSINDLSVKLPVGEKTLQYIKEGESVDVFINSLGKNVTGRFAGILPVADEKTKNIFLKISLPEVPGTIENMSATVMVPISHRKKLKMISRDALVKFQGKDFIYSVKDGKAVILPVNVVLYSGKEMGIDNEGYALDIKIVVSGNERLRPDQAVNITGEI